MQTYPMLIDGRLVQSREADPVINPAHGAPFADCARASKSHVDEAVAAAARAYKRLAQGRGAAPPEAQRVRRRPAERAPPTSPRS